jgi:hypothetical protein
MKHSMKNPVRFAAYLYKPCMIEIAAREPYDFHVLQWYMWLLEQGHCLVTAAKLAGFTVAGQ